LPKAAISAIAISGADIPVCHCGHIGHRRLYRQRLAGNCGHCSHRITFGIHTASLLHHPSRPPPLPFVHVSPLSS
jgi:hypothetical protein